MFPKTLRASCLALAMAAATGAAAQTEIIMSNDNNEKGLKGQTFDLLVSELECRLGDKARVEMHHSGTLFDQQSQIQGRQLGGVHIISPTAGVYSSVNANVGALQLPFLLNTPEKIQAAVADPVVREAIMPRFNEHNIEIVAVWMNGPRDLG